MKIEGLPGKLNFSKKLLISAAGIVAVAAPIVCGQENATKSQTDNKSLLDAPAYEVVSIKPNKSGSDMTAGDPYDFSRFTATSEPLEQLLHMAFGGYQVPISGIPNWAETERYDINAQTDQALADEIKKLGTREERRAVRDRLLQALLADRFQLKFHRETKELPGYWLVVAKAGKLHEVEGDCGPILNHVGPSAPEPGSSPPVPCGGFAVSGGPTGVHVASQKITLTQLAKSISAAVGRPVLDKTGLTEHYDITYDFTPEQTPAAVPPNGVPTSPPPDPNGPPSFLTAIQEQLGLKLVAHKVPGEVIVIDHIERPSEN